jgi:hypothetical protein
MRNIGFLLFFVLVAAEAKDLKTLVLVIASDDQPIYADFHRSWKSYMHLDSEHFESYFIRGNPDLPVEYEVVGDTIWTKTEENRVPGILHKTLVAFGAFFSRLGEFDYILRANLSSFFVFPRLLRFLETLPRENCYSGVYHGGQSRFPYFWSWVCGAGIIFSRDVVQLLVHNREVLLMAKLPDDMVIGSFLEQKKIPLIPGCYREIYSPRDWFEIQPIPEDVFHFRIKIDSADGARKWDGYLHAQLYHMFYGTTDPLQKKRDYSTCCTQGRAVYGQPHW